ncbi:MAG: L-lactate dehydrogenase [Clostridia bacterium]|nr:L-lactate dehydrogenase [Clostridia bacterium]
METPSGKNGGGLLKEKVVILGAGHVGSHVAMALAADAVCGEIVLVDKVPGKAEAQAADIADSLSFRRDVPEVRAGSCRDCADAAVTVCAIGKPREAGQTRLDLLKDSVVMVTDLARSLKATPPGGLVISITNPCDIIAGCLREALGIDRRRCFGTGTLLDTARLKRILSEQTRCPRGDIRALVMGEHGDSSMIPFSFLRVMGNPAAGAPGFDPGEALRRTRQTGMDIIEGKGSTEFGIGEAAAFLIRVILTDEKTELPLSVSLEGEYGAEGVSCGVPCLVGRDGIEKIIGIDLTEDERKAFDCSLDVLKKYTDTAKQYAEDE